MMTFGLTLNLRQRAGTPALAVLQNVVQAWSSNDESPEKQVKVDEIRSDSGRVWELRTEKINTEETGYWSTEIRAFERAADDADMVMTLTMHVESGDAGIRPLHYRVSVPHVLAALARDFEVRVSNDMCTLAPDYVDSRQKVDHLVASLSDAGRALPVILVSETQDEELLLPSLDESLAQRLFGIARVMRIGAFQTQQLTNRIGKEMSCFHGGVRVYWPGWGLEAPLLAHRLFTRLAILENTGGDVEVAKKRLAGKLMTMLARASLGSFRYPAQMLVVFDEVRLASLKSADGIDFEKEYFRLLDELKNKEEAIQLLERRLTAQSVQIEDSAEHSVESEEDTAWGYTVPEAIAAARIDFGSHISMPDRVVVDGNISGGTLYHFLKALRDVCEMVRGDKLSTNMGEALRATLAACGISQGKFKMGDTGVNAILRNGESRECRYRYHLRSGAPGVTESIYWADEGDGNSDRHYVVARIGLHA